MTPSPREVFAALLDEIDSTDGLLRIALFVNPHWRAEWMARFDAAMAGESVTSDIRVWGRESSPLPGGATWHRFGQPVEPIGEHVANCGARLRLDEVAVTTTVWVPSPLCRRCGGFP